MRADVMERDGDLAVVLLAEGPAILPLDPDGMLAILGERGVIHDEDGMRSRERFCHDSIDNVSRLSPHPKGSD